MTAKERIVCAVLKVLYDTKDNFTAFEHMTYIRLHMEGYEKMLDDYAKQIIQLLESDK